MMKQPALKLLASALIVVMFTGVATVACAAALTQNVTLTGTITPQPATCSFGAPQSLAFNGNWPNANIVSPSTDLFVTCSNGLAYTVATLRTRNPVKVGTVDSFVEIRSTSGPQWDIYILPVSKTGNGVAQNIGIWGSLTADYVKGYGAVTGSVPIVISY